MVSVFDIISGKKKENREMRPKRRSSKLRIMGWDAQEQKAYEEAKGKIFRREARKEGRKRAEAELFKEEREIKEKKRIRKARIDRLRRTGEGVGRFGAKRVTSVLSIQTPKVSKSAKKGLFQRSKFRGG